MQKSSCFILLIIFCGLINHHESAVLFSADEVELSTNVTDELWNYTDSAASVWLGIALEATAREHARNSPRPTIGSRMLAIIITSMYDAWVAYDDKAVGSRLGGKLRRPSAEHTLINKAKAIAYASYRAMLFLFLEDETWLVEQMCNQGFDPNDTSTDLSTPQGVGNTAAAAVISYRRHDGANQLGDEIGSNNLPYSDYTSYQPVNTADNIVDPNRWQPIEFVDSNGVKTTPNFLTPHWYLVKPFALLSSDQFRASPPPKVNSTQLREDTNEVLFYNENLTPVQKATVEYMRDGPSSTGQAGHWLTLAQLVSRQDKNDLDRDVKLFFTVANAAFDAFIAAWDTKRAYDTSRPWTLVRYYFAGERIEGWVGPGKGVATLRAEDWHPYSPLNFITPPFPGYVSGHSAVSGACAKVLELFTGSDQFGHTEQRIAGILTEPGFDCRTMQMRYGQILSDANLTCNVTLLLPTFSATLEMAGISRVMGGYHIQTDNIEGMQLGHDVAMYIWPKLQGYFDGTAAAGDSSSAKSWNKRSFASLACMIFLFYFEFTLHE